MKSQYRMFAIADRFEGMDAHDDFLQWFVSNRDPKAAWESCKDEGWFIWSAVMLGVERRLLTLAACECAILASTNLKDPSVSKCIKAIQDWTSDKTTLADVKKSAKIVHHVAEHVDQENPAYHIVDLIAEAISEDDSWFSHHISLAVQYCSENGNNTKCMSFLRKHVSWDLMEAAYNTKFRNILLRVK